MSPASRAVNRLRELYSSVFHRMRQNEAQLADPLAGRCHFRGIELLEPRLLLSVAPTLPGLHLVDPTADRFDGQVIYLDFDGAQDVDYNGPVTVEDIDVLAFAAPGTLAGQEQAIIDQVLLQLADTFDGSGLVFTTEHPAEGAEYSTIYIGGSNQAFSRYGNFQGLAETIDIGNQIKDDNAFVFSDCVPLDKLADTTAHEIGHLLGYAHDGDDTPGDDISDYAQDYKQSLMSNENNPTYGSTGSDYESNITVDKGSTHRFIVDGVFGTSESCYYEWYSSNSGASGFLESGYSDAPDWTDPTISRTFNSTGSYVVRAEIWDKTWTGIGEWWEAHRWYVTVVNPDTQGPYAPPDLEMEEGNGYYSPTDNPTFDWSTPNDRGGGSVVEYRYEVDDPSPDKYTTSSSYCSSYRDNLSNGSHTFYVQAKDNSNNWGDIASMTFYVDDENPDSPSIDLTAGSDSGHSNTDNITNDNTPQFYFSGMDDSYSGIDRLYYRVDSGSWQYVNEPGSTEYVTLSSLGNGSHTIYAYTTDEAGNSSSTNSLGFTVDTSSPSTPWIDLRSSSDSGYSSSDNITNDSTPTVDFGSSSDTYRLYYDVGDTGPDYDYDSGSSGSWTTWGLGNGTSYVYVQAVDNAGNWSGVGSLGIVVDTVAPSVPSLRNPADGVTISDLTPTLEWYAASDSTSGVYNYQLTYETAAPFDEVTIDVSGTSRTLSLTEDHWYWRVRATDKAGNQSSESTERDFYIVTNHDPTQPGSLAASNVTKSSAIVSWGSSSDADGDTITYYIEYGKTDVIGDGWTSGGSTTGTSKTLTGLDPDTRYTVRVKATDPKGGESSWRESSALFRTDLANYDPTQPGSLSASDVQQNSASVSWGPSNDPDGDTITYHIEYGKTDVIGDGWTSGGATTGTSKTLTGLDADTRYTVRVRATDPNGGESDWREASALFRTDPAPQVVDVRWERPYGTETSEVDEGDTVYLVVEATGFGTGQVFSADVWEADLLDPNDPVAGATDLTLSHYSGNIWRRSWSATWMEDKWNGFNNDPEYFFELDSYGNKSGEMEVRDKTAPGSPLFDSANSSHQPNVWSASNDLNIWWSEPADGSGIAGYSILINYSSTGTPDTTVDTANRHYSLADTVDTANLWLHVRAVDNSGNWATSISHFGPFKVDTTKPDVPSASNPGSTDSSNPPLLTETRPLLSWAPASDDGGSGISHYIVDIDWKGDGLIPVWYATSVENRSVGNVTSYTVPVDDTLDTDEYRWRVKAVDNVGKESDWSERFFGVQAEAFIANFSVVEVDPDGDGYAHELEFRVTVDGAAAGLSNGSVGVYEDDWFFDDTLVEMAPITLAPGEIQTYSATVRTIEYEKLWGDGLGNNFPYCTAEYEFIAKLKESGGNELDSFAVNQDTRLEILDGDYWQHLGTPADLVENGHLQEYYDALGGKPTLTFGGSVSLAIDDLIWYVLGAGAGTAAAPGPGTAGGVAMAESLRRFTTADVGFSLYTQYDVADLMGLPGSDADFSDGVDENDWITVWQTGGISSSVGLSTPSVVDLPFSIDIAAGFRPIESSSLLEDPSIMYVSGGMTGSAKAVLFGNLGLGGSVGVNGTLDANGFTVDPDATGGIINGFSQDEDLHVGASTLTPASASIGIESSNEFAITYEIRADALFTQLSTMYFGLPYLLVDHYVDLPAGSFFTPSDLASSLWAAIEGDYASTPYIRPVTTGGSPEIDVERGATDNVHSHAFGQVTLGQSASQVFTVRNEGDAPLSVSHASGLSGPFSINPVNGSGTSDDWVVDAGSTRQFIVTYQPTTRGGHNTTLTLANNDSDEGSYQIIFTGTGIAPAEIEVEQYTSTITNNSSLFDFGSVLVGSGGREFIFTISNLGDLDLSVGNVTLENNDGFQVTQQPSSSVSGGDSTTFWIKMLDEQAGPKSANVRFSNGDGDENPFIFTITGLVLPEERTAPVATIEGINPDPAQPPSDTISFNGDGCDLDGEIVAWEWTSDLELAPLSTAEDWTIASSGLTVGTHTITLRVQDNDNLWSEPVTQTLVVSNALPTAQLQVVSSGEVYPGDMIDLVLGGYDNDEQNQAIQTGKLFLDGVEIAAPLDHYRLTAPSTPGEFLLAYRVQDDEGYWSEEASAVLVVDSPRVVDRHVFYNNSRLDEEEYLIAAAITATSDAPMIDGVADPIWNDAAAHAIGCVVFGATESQADSSGQWKALWDSSNLYFYVEVKDDARVKDSTVIWSDDTLEIYLDPDHSRQSSYDQVDDVQYLLRWDDGLVHVSPDSVNRIAGVEFQMTATDLGYVTEVAIPWATLGLSPAIGSEFGLELSILDDDDGGDIDSKVQWYGPVNDATTDPSTFATVYLTGQDATWPSMDDSAIDDSKEPLLEGLGTSVNATAYAAGINGLMLDMKGISTPSAFNLINLSSCMEFSVWDFKAASGWIDAPDPTFLSLRENVGTDGSDRITVIWEDDAIKNQWFRVVVKAGMLTGLLEEDVFYFGNLAGDANGDLKVDISDFIVLKQNYGSGPNADISQADYDCSGTVDIADFIVLKQNYNKSLEWVTYPEISRVSTDSSEQEADGRSRRPSISEDGQFVAYKSDATNLIAGDTNGVQDIFVTDRESGETRRISVSNGGVQGNQQSDWPAISPDGRYVVFSSDADNLVANDTNGKEDVFLYDLQTGAIEALTLGGDGDSYAPAINRDGSVIAFTSLATNLVAGDDNVVGDVFVYDTQTGQMTMISVSPVGDPGDMQSEIPAISANGRYVTYHSRAGNIVPGATTQYVDVFIYDRNTGQNELVSVSIAGEPGSEDSHWPVISEDGRYVSFMSEAGNLVANDINGCYDIFVRDRLDGTTTRINATPVIQANDLSYRPSMSLDGRYIAFMSLASNLAANDTNGKWDVFLYDQDAQTLSRISIIPGQETDGDSKYPVISGNGEMIVFESDASNLVDGDQNGVYDIFAAI